MSTDPQSHGDSDALGDAIARAVLNAISDAFRDALTNPHRYAGPDPDSITPAESESYADYLGYPIVESY